MLPLAALAGAAVALVVVVAMPSPDKPVMPAASPGPSASGSAGGWGADEPPLPELPMSAVVAGDGASRTAAAGVPVGFARSAEGAAAAATAWLAAVEGGAGLDPARRPAMLAAIGDGGFVAGAGSRLAGRAATLNLLPDGRPSNNGVLVATVWPTRGAFRVTSIGDAAEVEIWYLYQLGVTAVGGRQPDGVWRRASVSLRWDAGAGDWRVTGDFGFAEGPDARVAQPSRLDRAELLAPLGGGGWRLYRNTQE
ncbi:MAG: hypothetical protein JXA67_12125 [Micromonosporaceae bacterium]|nr:hypothetical protein [Micromonosporaceae bacterium]